MRQTGGLARPPASTGSTWFRARTSCWFTRAAEMADAIERLLASPAECHRLAAAGRRRVEESYGWDEIARCQTEIYREVIR